MTAVNESAPNAIVSGGRTAASAQNREDHQHQTDLQRRAVYRPKVRPGGVQIVILLSSRQATLGANHPRADGYKDGTIIVQQHLNVAVMQLVFVQLPGIASAQRFTQLFDNLVGCYKTWTAPGAMKTWSLGRSGTV